MEHEQHILSIGTALRWLAAASFFIAIWQPLSGVCREVGQVNRQGRQHPDGTVGQVSLHGYADYASVSTKPGHFAPDAQIYALGLDLVAGARIALQTEYELFKQDSVRHCLRGGIKFYLKDPLQEGAPRNPDGQIGGVVLSLGVGGRFSDSPSGATKRLVDISTALPVSMRLSLAAGYRYYEEIEINDAMQAYGGVTVYFSEYSADSAYVNPDGSIGHPILNLSGGGSPKGVFSRISIIFPIQREVSLTATLAVERIKSPYRLALTAGVGLSVYPHR